MNVFSLFASLKLDRSEYEKGLDEAQNQGNDFAKNTKDKISPALVAGWTAVVTAIIAVGKKINEIMNQSLQYADQIGETANKLGVATETIGEMSYIATQTGTTIERLSTGMSMLYMKAQSEGDAFKQLGISVKDSNGNFKAMDELFYETIGVLNTLESDSEKSAYMLQLFGRQGAELGEILRKDTEELNAMRQEAHDLGIVIDQETADFAGSWFDKIDQVKLQGQSALASLVAGAPDAEEKLQNFIDNVLEMLDGYIPTFANFSIRLLLQVALGLIRTAPSLAIEIVTAIQDAIFGMDWFQFGIDLGKSILEGLLNIIISTLNRVLGYFGAEIPKVNLNVGENVFDEEALGGEYEISENLRQEINVKVEASGDSAVSEETAEKTAQALAPYIDKILGGM